MTDNQRRIEEYLKEHAIEMAGTLSDIIRFNTENEENDGPPTEKEAQAYIYKVFSDMGLDPVNSAFDEKKERNNVYGTWKGVGNGKHILLHAHMDTVAAGDASLWDHKPFSGDIENGCVYGRGAVDDKGGIAAMVWALKAIQDCGIQLNGDVTLMSCVAEETNEGYVYGAGKAVEAMESKPDFSISCEGTEMDYELCGATMTGFEITVKGKSAMNACRNQAVWPQPYGIKCGNEIAVDAFEKALPIIELLWRKERDWNLNRRHPVWGSGGRGGHDTNGVGMGIMNLSMIHGGELPHQIMGSIKLTYRLSANPNMSVEEINKEIVEAIEAYAYTDSWLRENPPEIKLGILNTWPGHYLDIDHPITKMCESVYKELFNKQPVYSSGRCNDDASWMAQLGIPALTVGAGGAVRMHNVNEFIEIPALCEAAKLYAALIMEFCEVVEK